MSRKFYRRGPWRRLLSSFLVVAFTLSFTGVGFAEPAEPEAPADVAAPTADTQAPTADATPPQEEPAPVAEPAPASDPPPVEPSVEPAPQSDSPELAKNGRGPTGGTADEHAAPAGNDAAPTDVVADPAPSVTAAAVTAAGGSVSIELEGWRTTPSSEWSKGNLGTLWNEGDWVQYRVIIDNSGGDAVVNYGAFSLIYDHLNSNKNAIGVDMTRDWHIYYTPTQPDDSDPRTHSGSGISPSAQDVGFPSGSSGSADFLKTSFPAGTAVIPAGQYAVVMFEAHLSITAWWQQQSPARFGSSYYPGSSMQMRVESPSGAKTVPIPIPPKPAGYVDGVKFNDYDHDGVRDAGEPGLAGWEFHLHDGPAGFPLDLHATSAADGSFTFGPLPGATYSLSEVAQANWTNSTPLPMTIVVPSGSRVATDVGNYHSDVTKTWELSVSNVPAGASFFVRYSVNGQTKPDKALTGSGPYTGSDTSIPYGASVDTSYYASYAGETLFLGHQGPETLTSNFTNRFSWDSSVTGHKFGDVNANGRWDTGTTELGLSGWSIDLYRLPAAGGSPVLYTSQLTGAGGAYSFTDVLPGTYYVRENLTGKTGWFQTTPNPSNFGVSAADRTESGLNFGNVEVRAAIDIEKTGPTLAHEGDTITYSFTLQNIGNTTLTGVTANDPLLGGVIFGPVTLASSESTTFSRTYVVPSPRETVDNTVTAFGYDLLQGMVSDFDTWQVDVIHPAISIAKTVDFDGNGAFSDSEMGYAGDTAVWRLLVSNTGDVALADVMVTDTNGSSFGPYSLGVGASQIVTYGAVITTDKVNAASASGRDPLRLTVNAGPDSAAVDVIDPDIQVRKSVDADGDGYFGHSEVAYPGATALWKIIVRNTGDVTLTAVTLTDSNGHSFPAPFTLA
ncbi:MAG: hypothetical protein C0418_05635, partial [Coriobacteriaceae bacterium]|nr:hypothetical protein [Coriobacteriaceae bacterium]